MTVKGYRLHVHLSASQARRRLKGYGFGVRKVESAGKQESIVIHTATGDNLRRLCGLFQDVLAAPPAPPEDAAVDTFAAGEDHDVD